MADPALNPRNPDDAAADPSAGDTGAPRTDQAGGEPEELDLEAQVDALLSEVSETVEQISKRFDPDPAPPGDEVFSGDAAITDEGATEAVEHTVAAPTTPETDAPESEAAQSEAQDDPAPESETPEGETEDRIDTDSLDEELAALAAADEIDEIATEPEAPEPAAEDGPIDGVAAEADETDDATPDDAAPDAAEPETLTAASVQAELDAALDGLGDPEPTEPPTPAPPVSAEIDDDPEVLAAAADALLKKQDDAEPEDADQGAADYTDANALDDELAALAGGDDFEGEIELVEGPRLPEPPTATEPIDAEADAGDSPPADADADQTTSDAPVGDEASAPDTTPEPVPAALRWGWLPPKPGWPEAFGRARPLVIAWRHAAWVVPPFLAFVWSHLWARTKRGAIAAEPRLRHAAAVIAAPLSRRDEKTRSLIGYLSVWTLFWSACVWVWVLVGRSPVVPEPSTPPAGLQGEPTTEIAAD